eukprot:gnl/MRDRNA2_/MRDRNA2_84276_c0_seq3.p1 gnl/MRDRNA2_/MRDRNA2_84276_c0~~gnl/MRDRNA2_/MRDRNA2_84276_c0_seq3.p1  ORF type:complete len:373 (-),score=65.44 gnl/MRDRNA2_/MRDRNA2_84276_c0_seq3:235-1353(-)
MTMTMKLETGINSVSDILPLIPNAKEDPENDFASTMSTVSSDGQQEEAPQPPLKSFARTLWRTKICKHFLKGTCRYGDKCGFAHSDDAINEKPNLVKTTMCSRFQKGCCLKGASCQFAHGQGELKSVHEFEDALIMENLKDDNVRKSKAKSNAKKNMSRTENSKQAMPLDQPLPGGLLEPMKVNLDDVAYGFARQTTRPPHNLDGPGAHSMQPNLQEMMPAIQGFEKPYSLQRVLKERMQFQPMQAPPGLGNAHSQGLVECQRLRQDLNLDDGSPVPEDSNLHYELRALCMGLVNNLKGSMLNPGGISGYSPSLQCEKPAMRGNYSNSMEGIDHTFADFGMTRFNFPVFGDNVNTLKCGPGDALSATHRQHF